MLPFLLELRRRLLNVIIVFAFISLGCFYYSRLLFHWLIYPLQHQLPPGHTLIVTKLTSAVLTPLNVALHAACLLTAPYLIWQIWQFVHPALYDKERQVVGYPLIISMGLFIVGMQFAYWLVLPCMFQFFINYLPEQVQMMPDIAYGIDFITRMMFIFGACFQVPLICYLLVRASLLSYAHLKQSRPYVIVGAFIIGMLLTPPDVVSQVLLAVPIWLLFEMGLMAGMWADQQQQAQSWPSELSG